jgi:hypothetical protein
VSQGNARAVPGADAHDGSLFPFPLSRDIAAELNARSLAMDWNALCDTKLEFDRRELSHMREVWRSHCRPDRLPSRAQFDARVLKPFLREIVILEAVPHKGRWRYLHRLVGSAIAERTGETTGKFLDEIIPEPVHEKTVAYFDAVIEHRCPLRVINDYDVEAMNHTRGEIFLMPLADDGVTPNMLLTVSYIAAKPTGMLPLASRAVV